MSHLGRPDGSKKMEFSMKPLLSTVEDLLQRKVGWINDCMGEETKRRC